MMMFLLIALIKSQVKQRKYQSADNGNDKLEKKNIFIKNRKFFFSLFYSCTGVN